MRTLRVISGPAAGQSLDVERELLIGREQADLVIADPEVSRRHATLRPADGGIVVEDLGSTNGTFVNGSRITGAVTLSETDSLRIGGSDMSVDIESPPEDATSPPEDATSPPEDATAVRSVVPDDATQARSVPRDAGGDAHKVAAAAPATSPPAPATPPPLASPAVTPRPQPAAPAAQQPAAPQGAQPSAPSAPGVPAAPAAPGGAPPDGAAPSRVPRARGPMAFLPAAIVVVLAIVIAVLVIATTNSSSKKNHVLSASINSTLLSQTGSHALLVGIQTGTPGGSGSLTRDAVLTARLRPHGPAVPSNEKVISRFDGGSFFSTIRATATPQANGSVKLTGRGVIDGGTGKFKNATGSYTVKGGWPRIQQPNQTFRITGKIKY